MSTALRSDEGFMELSHCTAMNCCGVNVAVGCISDYYLTDCISVVECGADGRPHTFSVAAQGRCASHKVPRRLLLTA